MVHNNFLLKLLFLVILLFISKPCYGSDLTFKAIEDVSLDEGVITNNRRLIVSNTNNENNMALLKFNINDLKSLKSQEVTSVKLKVYVDKSTTKSNVNAYYELNDNWTELQSNKQKYLTTFKTTDNHGTASSISTSGTKDEIKWIVWDLTALNIPEIQNSDSIITIAFDDVSKASLNSKTTFFSKEYCCVYAPQLIISTNAIPNPTPEPSSLILGVLSIVGLLGLKNRIKID